MTITDTNITGSEVSQAVAAAAAKAVAARKAASDATAPGAEASHLDASKWGFDLVCATTQDSINATLKEFLDGYQGQEFTACYTFDPQSGKKVLTPLQDIVTTIGGDPFSIPNGAGTDNQMLQKLYNDSKFMFGFRAKMGLPQGVAPADMPDIIRLDRGTGRVSYRLYCSEFSVLTLESNFGDLQFTNLEQSPSDPWIFLFEVNLDMRQGDQDAFNSLPPSVQQRIKSLNPDSMFSVQQLYLDLNSAGLQGEPSIQGLDSTTDAYVYLTRTFIEGYWKNLGTSGVLLGYSVAPVSPDPNPSSIEPTDLNIEISPYIDAQGNQSTNYSQYTLNYLVMSRNAAMPAFAPFEWNWVEQSQAADFDGVMAVRRNVFLDFLQSRLADASSLSVDTNVDMTHSGETFTTTISYGPSSNPAKWTPTADGVAAGTDGYTPLLTIAYGHDSYDSSEDALHLSSINGTFNYNLNGDISVNGNVLRMTVHTVAYAELHAHIVGIDASSAAANVLDYLSVVTFTFDVDSSGTLVVTKPAPAITDRSGNIDIGGIGSALGLGDADSVINSIRDKMKGWLEGAIDYDESHLADTLNNSGAWHYPGGKTFSYKQVAFSDHQDLITHVTYVDPS